jgi:hypothetical protein
VEREAAGLFHQPIVGKPIKRVRAGDGISILPGRRLSLHVMVQPDAAVGFLADRTLRDQGLLSRVLVSAPASIAGSRLYREADPQDEAAIRSYGARLLSILEAPAKMSEGKRNELEPRALEMALPTPMPSPQSPPPAMLRAVSTRRMPIAHGPIRPPPVIGGLDA